MPVSILKQHSLRKSHGRLSLTSGGYPTVGAQLVNMRSDTISSLKAMIQYARMN